MLLHICQRAKPNRQHGQQQPLHNSQPNQTKKKEERTKKKTFIIYLLPPRFDKIQTHSHIFSDQKHQFGLPACLRSRSLFRPHRPWPSDPIPIDRHPEAYFESIQRSFRRPLPRFIHSVEKLGNGVYSYGKYANRYGRYALPNEIRKERGGKKRREKKEERKKRNTRE